MSKEAKNTCLVPIGRIVRPHGIKGALKIFPYGETLSTASPGEKLLLQAVEETGESGLTIIELRPQAKYWIGRFEEISTVDQARELSASEVFVPRDRLPPLEEGEFYQFQLIGLTAQTKEGRILGTVRGIIETGGNDVYVLDCEGKELLIPAVEDVVCEIDLARKRMIVQLPEGLE